MELLEYPFDSEHILKKKRSIKKELLKKEGLLEKKVAILSGSTVGELQNILELFLLNQGIKPIFYQGSYNRFYEEIVYDNANLKEFNPDIIYIHTTMKNIVDFPNPFESKEEIEEKMNSFLAQFKQMWEVIQKEFNCPIVQNNFEYVPYRLMGNADSYRNDGMLNFINLLNQELYEYAREKETMHINDLNYQAAWYGLEKWFDNSSWYLYKYPFAVNAIPLVSHNLANIMKSVFGKNRKAIAVDLDNTLWGGVIGDDAVEGIELGLETAKGMAYLEFQKYLKSLSKLGIALNVCSKNEETLAKSGFQHASSVLKEEDFIVIKANWDNKDENIKKIALDLNIFTDSIVFLDDNPVERELVQNNLPEVAVPSLTNEQDYIKILDQSGFFELTTITEEDRKRKDYFKMNQLRQSSTVESTGSYEDYLQSLKMTSIVEKFIDKNMNRVVQLINKTNQFNLTTKRYTIGEVSSFLNEKNSYGLSFKLVDKFGDNGIVSVLMATAQNGVLEVDLWVMSCRVFKRDLEKVIFDELVKLSLENNLSKIRGNYYPTEKNKIVAKLYRDLGFTLVVDNNGASIWEYEVSKDYQQMNTIMEVISNE